MPFSHATATIAFVRAEGQCECTSRICRHPSRCTATFRLQERVTTIGPAAGWVVHHRRLDLAEGLDGLDGVANCEILCLACSALRIR